MNLIKNIDDVIGSLKRLRNNMPSMIYIPEHFIIEELVDPQTFKDRGQKAFELLDPLMLWTLDRMRENFGKISINTWKWGGQYKYSGFRPKNCVEGSYYSQHRLGRAFDLKLESYKPEEIRQAIKDDPDNEIFKYINCVENGTPTWLHIDGRHTQERIKWVNP